MAAIRKYVIGGNWKCVCLALYMSTVRICVVLCLINARIVSFYASSSLFRQNGTKQSVRELIDVLNTTEIDTEQVDVIVAPPALHLELTKELVQKNIFVSAQNVSLTGLGAYTGEIAAEQLVGE